jgi:hypothetical protein
MTEHKNIYMALAAAQANMGQVFKGATNPHFQSKYANLADVMQVATPALNAEGVAAWHSVVNEEGTSYMRTTLSHGATDTHINCDVPLLVGKNDMQGMKSATTYAKRIGIESLTGIAPEDDDGNAAVSAANDARKKLDASVKALKPSIDAIKQALAESDLSTASEAWAEMTDEEKASIWAAPTKGGPFTTLERETMKSPEFRKAREA